MINHYNILVQK